MRRLAARLFLAVLVLVALGCTEGSVGAGTPTPAASPVGTPPSGPITPTPGATATASPTPERRTGDADIDRIIEAVERQDLAALLGVTALESVACVETLDGLGGPPLCEQGEPEGTVVEVFPAAYCEGVLDRFPGAVLGQFVSLARGLYAVTEGPDEPRSAPYWPVGDTFLVFHTETVTGMYAGRLVIEDGRIVMAWFGCPGTPADAASWRGEPLPLIAGPFEDPAPAAPAPHPTTGIGGVDAVIEAIARYDLGRLIERTRMGEQPCVEQVGDGAEVACNIEKGERAGDVVTVYPIAYCEGALTRDMGRAHRALLSYAPRLYGVVEAPASEPDRPVWRRGDYYLVYELHSAIGMPEAVRLVIDREGHILMTWYGCDPTAEDLIRHHGDELPIVLPPRR